MLLRCESLELPMSQMGQTPTSADVCSTTASPSKADMLGSPSDVAEVPITTFAPYRIDVRLR